MEETMKNGSVRVVAQVPLIDGLQTSYEQFRDQYMRPNLPVLISGLMEQWRAFRAWSSPSGAPEFDYLTSCFGNSHVQVAECSTKEFTDQKRVHMTVAEYIAYWKLHNSDRQELDDTNSLLYLKDWHFVKDYPDYGAYSTPLFFMDDWLNFYLEHYQLHGSTTEMDPTGCLSDYRFVYMGPKGTWTPLHADVFRSYSWSGNVCGRKLWHLLPPSETHLIFDRHMRSSVYDIYGDISVEEYPYLHKAGWVECVQERGQILFVPSGWYHQVTNLEDTISINHNWFNGYNLHSVCELLLADYEETRASIEDIKPIADNFEELCQRNLAANSGMNLCDLFVFLRRMMIFFISCLCHNSLSNKNENTGTETWFSVSDVLSTCSKLGSQMLFNLQSIGHVAQILASVDVFERYLLATPTTMQMTESCDQSGKNGGRLESDYLACWLDSAQHSEYQTFLSKLISSCTCTGTPEACLSANPIGFEGLKSFELIWSKKSGGLQDYEAVVVGSINDLEMKVKAPLFLAKFLEQLQISLYELIE